MPVGSAAVLPTPVADGPGFPRAACGYSGAEVMWPLAGPAVVGWTWA